MKQIVKDGDTPFLPQEIIRNILKRLPAKTLTRFQCVCREWKNLFKTPSFIKEHHHHSINQNPCLLLQQNRRGHFHVCLLDREMQVLGPLNAPAIDPLSCIRIIGCSDGLLCVEIDRPGISPPSLLLWNPAINEVRQVPRTIDGFKGRCCLGFGFSPIVNDYKIVRIYVPRVYNEYDSYVDRVEVYSLSTGSWKEVEFGNLDNLIPCPGGVTANGIMFWCGLKVSLEVGDEVKNCNWIISFDIATEGFGLIPMPFVDSHAVFNLVVYENKLAIVSEIWSGSYESFVIVLWVMEEGMGASGERWSLTENIPINFCSGLCLFYIQRNEIIGNINKDNYKDEFEEEMGVRNVLSMLYLSECGKKYPAIFDYAESLVPVSNTHIDGDTLFLPQEIISNILKRLPAKTLIRFQCVCREWKNLFKTPSFIKEHHHHSINQNPCLLLQHNHEGDLFHVCLLNRKMQVLGSLNAPVIDPLSCIRIIGCSDGLLCVEINRPGISPPSLLLWNPAINEVRQVPRTIDGFKGRCCLGFGFSPIVNDYKIVRIYVPRVYNEYDSYVDRVEVYSLSTGSWKEVEFGNFDNLIPHGGVTANGIMFWCGLKVSLEVGDEVKNCNWIISFDIATEGFGLIPMPFVDSRAVFNLVVYENKLAIVSEIWSGSYESFVIVLWVMEEGMGASGERWSLIKNIPINFCSGLCLSCIQRNKIVGNIDKDNYKDKFEEEMGVRNVLSMLYLSKCGKKYPAIFDYAESLVPVSNTHIEELGS